MIDVFFADSPGSLMRSHLVIFDFEASEHSENGAYFLHFFSVALRSPVRELTIAFSRNRLPPPYDYAGCGATVIALTYTEKWLARTAAMKTSFD